MEDNLGPSKSRPQTYLKIGLWITTPPRLLWATAALMIPAAASWAIGQEELMSAWDRSSYEEAFKLAQPLAAQNDAMALLYLGRCHEFGRKPCKKDSEEAKRFYLKTLAAAKPAAESGDKVAQYVLGSLFEYGEGTEKNADEAARWYRLGADQGFAKAQRALGQRYNDGSGVPKSYEEAAAWVRKAAEQGDPEGQRLLGALHLRGEGVSKDQAEAARWMRLAADQGYARAIADLGKMHETGEGVEKDLSKSIALYRKAAEKDDAGGQTFLGDAYLRGNGVAQSDREAVRWLRKAAEQDDEQAQRLLGWMYAEGRGVRKDLKEAAALYRKSAEQGDMVAQHELGLAYANSLGVTEDQDEASRWFLKAAEQGDAESQYTRAMRYSTGKGSDKNLPEALKWFRKAADLGHTDAQFQLGRRFSEGIGTSPDEREAVDWFRKAALQGHEPAKAQLAILTQGRPQAVPPASGAGITKEDLRAMIEEATSKNAAQASKPAENKPAPLAEPASDVDVPKYRVPEDPTKFAVVIGIESYSQELPAAQFSERDAKAVKEHLTALGVPPRNLAYLTGPKASLGGIRKNLETWLPNNAQAGSTVFFYYSGHGSPDPATGEAYLVPWDGDPAYLKDTAYPMGKVYAQLSALKARMVVVVLDSCFSGQKGRSVLAKGARPLVTQVKLQPAGQGKIVLFTASGADQISGVLDDQGHGALTYFFLKGLNGSASDPQGGVTVKTLFDYLKPKVQDAAKRQNRDQMPQLLSPSASDTSAYRLR